MQKHTKTKLFELFAGENTNVINFASFKGNDKVDLIERENFGEVPLFITTKKLLDKINLYNKTTSVITNVVRIDNKLVESIAVRELLINAIVHNDYSIGFPNVYWYEDKMEITSNGGLPIGMTFEEFYEGQSRARNPKIAFIFSKLGLVEQLGSGIERVLKYYDKSIFEITDSYFKVTLKFNEYKNTKKIEANGTIKEQIMYIIESNDGLTIQEISEKLELSQKTINRYVIDLLNEMQILRNKKGRAYIYFKNK